MVKSLSPQDYASIVAKWAEKHAHHDNENPNCYTGTCRCVRRLGDAAFDLLTIINHAEIEKFGRPAWMERPLIARLKTGPHRHVFESPLLWRFFRIGFFGRLTGKLRGRCFWCETVVVYRV